MKTLYLIPLLLIAGCTTNRPPKLAIRLQEPPPLPVENAVRYPEVVHAYHVGRYADSSDDLLMHGEHVVWRIEAGSRWDFHPATPNANPEVLPAFPNDPAFAPLPVNDAVLAEVNAQKAATAQIMLQSKTLSAALAQFQATLQETKTNLHETVGLRLTVMEMKRRLDAFEAAQRQTSFPLSTTNEPAGSFEP